MIFEPMAYMVLIFSEKCRDAFQLLAPDVGQTGPDMHLSQCLVDCSTQTGNRKCHGVRYNSGMNSCVMNYDPKFPVNHQTGYSRYRRHSICQSKYPVDQYFFQTHESDGHQTELNHFNLFTCCVAFLRECNV